MNQFSVDGACMKAMATFACARGSITTSQLATSLLSTSINRPKSTSNPVLAILAHANPESIL